MVVQHAWVVVCRVSVDKDLFCLIKIDVLISYLISTDLQLTRLY